jgi:hypothetical protein
MMIHTNPKNPYTDLLENGAWIASEMVKYTDCFLIRVRINNNYIFNGWVLIRARISDGPCTDVLSIGIVDGM